VVQSPLQLLLLPRFLYITIYNHECLWDAYENTIIERFIMLYLEYNFPSWYTRKLGFLESVFYFIGQPLLRRLGFLGFRYQTLSKSCQTLPKVSKYHFKLIQKV
jgi:hypothetical protein